MKHSPLMTEARDDAPQENDLRDKEVPRPREGVEDEESLPQTEETRRLVDLAQGGDAEALNELFQRYHSYMVDLARRRLGRASG